MKREESYATYLAYVAENRHNFEGIKNENQPLIQVSRIMPVQNLLAPSNKNATDPSQTLPTKCELTIIVWDRSVNG